MVDAGDLVVGSQHVLIEQIADRQIIRMIADRHHGDDLLPVQKKRQRPLEHDGGIDRIAVLIDSSHRLGEPGIVRRWFQAKVVHGPAL